MPSSTSAGTPSRVASVMHWVIDEICALVAHGVQPVERRDAERVVADHLHDVRAAGRDLLHLRRHVGRAGRDRDDLVLEAGGSGEPFDVGVEGLGRLRDVDHHEGDLVGIHALGHRQGHAEEGELGVVHREARPVVGRDLAAGLQPERGNAGGAQRLPHRCRHARLAQRHGDDLLFDQLVGAVGRTRRVGPGLAGHHLDRAAADAALVRVPVVGRGLRRPAARRCCRGSAWTRRTPCRCEPAHPTPGPRGPADRTTPTQSPPDRLLSRCRRRRRRRWPSAA